MSNLARKMIAIRLRMDGSYHSIFTDEELALLAWITAQKLISGDYSYLD